MASVKAMMQCIGVDTSAGLSVLGHLFGFSRRRVPTDPDTTVRAEVSLLGHVRGLQGRHVHLNVIKVGFDTLSAADFDRAMEKIDYATYRTRNIYRQVSLGVGRVGHYSISMADAAGYDDIGSEDEADDLSDDWSVFNSGIDCFVVRNISDPDFVGRADAIPGSCDKNAKDDGLVAGAINRGGGLTMGLDAFSRTFAHEIGHFMGLSHNHGARPDCPGTTNGCNNLMAQTRCATSCGGGTRTAVLLTSGQGSTMRGHCSVRSGC